MALTLKNLAEELKKRFSVSNISQQARAFPQYAAQSGLLGPGVAAYTDPVVKQYTFDPIRDAIKAGIRQSAPVNLYRTATGKATTQERGEDIAKIARGVGTVTLGPTGTLVSYLLGAGLSPSGMRSQGGLEGIGAGQQYGGLSRFSNPIVSRYLPSFAGQGVRPFLANRAVQGVANVVEGQGFNKVTDRPFGEGAIFDLVVGMVAPQFNRTSSSVANFRLSKATMKELIDAEAILRDANKYVDDNFHFSNPVAREKAVQKAIKDAREVVDRISAKYLSDKDLEKVAGDPIKSIKMIVDRHYQNKLANVPGMGIVESGRKPTQASKGVEAPKTQPTVGDIKTSNTQEFLQTGKRVAFVGPDGNVIHKVDDLQDSLVTGGGNPFTHDELWAVMEGQKSDSFNNLIKGRGNIRISNDKAGLSVEITGTPTQNQLQSLQELAGNRKVFFDITQSDGQIKSGQGTIKDLLSNVAQAPQTQPTKGVGGVVAIKNISDGERQINSLIGYSPSGANWKTEYQVRQAYLDEAKTQAPPEVVKQIELLESAIDDIRMAKEAVEEAKQEAIRRQLSKIEVDKQIEKIDRDFSNSFSKKFDKLNLDESAFYKIKNDWGRPIGISAKPTEKTKLKIVLREQKARETTARKEYREWERAFVQQENAQTERQAINNLVKRIQENTKSFSGRDGELKDISGVASKFKDVYRNFETVYGERFPQVKRLILDPFDKSKGNMIREQKQLITELEQKIVKGLGIKKNSLESAAVQQFGEGKITQADLEIQFGKGNADKIIKADRWFRQKYDQLLDDVNAMRAIIYPNNPEKQIPRRKDYYRHFKEITETLSGVLNLFDTPANIDPKLAGISYQTKPKSKWQSFMQTRKGDVSDQDAVGGFLDYIRAATYSKHIDQHIPKFRALSQELADSMSEQGTKFKDGEITQRPGDLNNFINYLNRFADDLAGKTNPADRELQEMFGRKAFNVLNWVNNRVKANVILGNASSSVAQIFNLPQGMASSGPRYWLPGFKRTMFTSMKPDGAMKQSDFISERYFKEYGRFDRGVINSAKKFAIWMTGALDEVGTKLTWNMHFEKALNEGIDNPIKFADDMTRKMVAGRGIGEVPIAQKSKLFQLVAPFQLEVANAWFVMKEFVDEKRFGALATMFILSRLMNEGAKRVRGSDVVFDPIEAFIEGYDAFREEKDKKVGAARFVGRVGGEVLSNLPLGQTLADIYPEYGTDIAGERITREELFGEGDPTRFGSGLLVQKGLQDPLYKILPRFGGQQIKRTIQGIQAYNRGYSESPSGRVRFSINKNPISALQTGIFGEYSGSNARRYFESGASPLGKNQSEQYKQSLRVREAYASGEKPFGQMPDNDFKILYENAQKTIDDYKDNSSKIRTGLKDGQTLEEAQEELSEAISLVKRMELEQPERVYRAGLEVYESGGGKTTEERVAWAEKWLNASKDQAQYDQWYQEMLESGVMTKSVARGLREKGISASLYAEGGKIKTLGGGGKKPKKITIKTTTYKAPKITIKRRSATQYPIIKITKPPKLQRIKRRYTIK